MRKLSWLLPLAVTAVALLLSSCASAPKPVTITVPCRVTLPAEPVYPFDTLPSSDEMKAQGMNDVEIAWKQVTTLLADRRVRIAHQRETRAAAEACQ